MMIISPVVALGFDSEVFVPVALTSVLGGVICLVCKSLATHMVVRQITAELLNDLVSTDLDRRELVFSELDQAERKWFELEIERIEAGSMSGRRTSHSDRVQTSANKAVIGTELDTRCGCRVGQVSHVVRT